MNPDDWMEPTDDDMYLDCPYCGACLLLEPHRNHDDGTPCEGKEQ